MRLYLDPMTDEDILEQRLRNQRVAGAPFDNPADVVHFLGGIQSQDYGGARWSVGQRVGNCTDADVARAFDAGEILRTHVLRPTWHFVTPADIRWLLRLTSPRVHALNAYYYRTFELDDAVFRRSQTVFADALQAGRQLTRAELASRLARAGIVADGLRLSYIMMHAELDGLICSGALRGKQHTYALLEDRAPGGQTFTHDQSLARLAQRFFVGHGPATLRDYVSWSGLTVAAARRGLEMVEHVLAYEVVNGRAYWMADSMPPPQPEPLAAYLLPEYDECLIAYKELTFPDLPREKDLWSDTFYRPVLIGGKRAGTWRRTVATSGVTVEANLFAVLDTAQRRDLDATVERYSAFMNRPVTLVAPT